MIEVKNLTKRYGNHVAVNGISFKIEPGRIYGFLGPNGAGKSTTMNMITGCLAPTEGEIKIDGMDIFGDAKRAKQLIGYLPELPPIYPELTPYEYLLFVAEAKGVKGSDRFEQVYTAMEETDLVAVKDRLIKNLSKGYKQRVGIAQAMLGDPKLIILDEPTVGLDPRQIAEIRLLIKRLGQSRTVILSSHILSEVSAVCDRVMIISNGNLVASDTLENIRKQFSEENRLLITAKTDKTTFEEVIGDTAGVFCRHAAEENGETSAELEITEDGEITEKLFFAFANRGIGLTRLTAHSITLEEVFLRLTDTALTPEDYSGIECEDEDNYENGTDVLYGEYNSGDSDAANIIGSINKSPENYNYGIEPNDTDSNISNGSDYKPLFGGHRGEEE